MGLAVLIIGLALFIASHAFVTQRKARAALIARTGELPYKALFSVVVIISLVLIVWGFAHYRAEGYIQVWTPPTWMRHVTVALVWPAIIFATAAYIPGDIKRTLKHPLLVGVKLWAFAHLLSNGDLGGIVLFGSILAWAVFDRITLKRRTDAGAPPIPLGGRRNDIIAVVVGTLLYLALGFWFHPYVIGKSVFM
jgi:uncharacterized membrane protein